jgi:queuine tRNA-ribosyltransferase subunit QTRTD1
MAVEAIKRVTFKILSDVDPNIAAPRLGRLAVWGRKEIETPNSFAVSSRGVIPHMTPDVIRSISQLGGVHMALEDCRSDSTVFECSSNKLVMEKSGSATPPLLNSPGITLHSFAALPHEIITLLAPRRTPAVSAPSGNTSTAISLFTSTGFQVLSNKQYVTAVRKLRPDITIALADVSYGNPPGAKRILKMGDRTERWVTELLDQIDEGQAVFAPILPIDSNNQLEYLNYLADEKVDSIAGLALFDTNLLPDLPATTAFAALPRLSLDEPTTPHHLLRQISLGVDVFTIPFVNFATDAGIALAFSFPGSKETTISTPVPLGIDMWTSSHSASLLSLVPSCTCYSCTSHHRAYIQHLLSAKEMLGWILLQIHNHHVLDEFFKAIRTSIKKDSFDADSGVFSSVYESELPEKSGQGPRIRGYNFKSGSEESKRNKPAWGNLGGGDQVEGDLVPGN